MTRTMILLLPAVLAISLSAAVRPASAYIADGMEYDVSCSADGYVLTSKYPVTRMIGTDVDTQAVPVVEKSTSAKAATPSTRSSEKAIGAGRMADSWRSSPITASVSEGRS
jgi:hypothetical protein